VFVNKVHDMQREINLPDAVAGVVQLIRNTADATIFGFEIESQVFLTDNFVFLGNVGHLNGEYDTVAFDLNSDGVTNEFDERLEIPRLAPWTYGAGFVHDLGLGGLGSLSTRFQWSHRDDNAYTDNNLGILEGADMIDASFALTTFDGAATISLYGQNLLNEVTHGGETQLPATLGTGTFAPLNKGRIVGVELQINM
jgi:iron complex outermembrane receptor protein